MGRVDRHLSRRNAPNTPGAIIEAFPQATLGHLPEVELPNDLRIVLIRDSDNCTWVLAVAVLEEIGHMLGHRHPTQVPMERYLLVFP